MGEQKTHPDQVYIDGLVQNNSDVIGSIYKKFAPKVIYYIKSNSGNEEAARDVIQEVLIVIYNQAKTSGLKLTCPFDAYFFLLCQRRWLNELKKPATKQVTISPENVSTSDSVYEMASETESFDQRQQLFEEMFLKIGEKCQELLKLSFVSKTMEEVAQKLNVTYAYVRKKKSLCTGKLTQLIRESGRYKALKN